MKKMILSLVATMLCATATYAQSSMLATLSHDGTISTFYGSLALRDAYNAANNGDVITLSSGTFNAVDIAKAVTIRGAGMGIDSTAHTEPTIITGDFKIAIPDSVTARLTLEGLYHNHKITIATNCNLRNATFLKCRFNTIDYGNTSYSIVTNLTMIHCKVAKEFSLTSNSSASLVNCCIMDVAYNATVEYVNCVLYGSFINTSKSSFKNCVLIPTSDSAYLYEGAVAYNCIGIGSGNLFRYIPNTTNVKKGYTNVFKAFTGTYNDNESFELTETAKTSYKGIDGTQVGIYGGNMPFSMTPSNPQITKCNVAAKSTADGKLSVDITVNGAE